MQLARMRQLAEMSLPELRTVLIRDIRKIPTARVKRRLWRYRDCRDLIDANVEHLQQLQSQARRITTVYNAVPGGGGPGSGRAEVIAQILQLEEVIKADTKRLQDELMTVRFMINSLDDFQERVILNYRYINDKTFEAIAEKLSYEVRQVYRIHGDALKNLVALEEKMSLNVRV